MRKYKLFIACLLSVLFLGHLHSQTISQWRGVNRDGIYNETKLLKSWPEKGPELLWFNEDLGNGYGSPAVTSSEIFINGEIDSTSYLFAYNLQGKLLWKSPNGTEFTGNNYARNFPGSRSTPTVVDNLIYVCSGNGRVACFDKQNGKEQWTVDMVKDFSGVMDPFGYSESLAVDSYNVYCVPAGANANVVALNRFTGKTIWTSKAMGDTATYCSPLIIDLPSRSIIVTFSVHYIMALDTKTGELLWSQEQKNVKYRQHCNTPIFANGYVYYVSGDGNGAVKLELSTDGKTVKEIWRNSKVKNNFNGFVILNNHLFTTDRTQKLKCIDTKTGQDTDTLKITKGALISANGMLYLYSDNGEVSLIKITDTKMEVVSKFKCEKGSKEHFAHPVIGNGVLYIRHGKALMAFDIKERL